jgi:hypothetical protein
MQSKSPAFAERMGVLMATGLIVGESLMGVVYAAAVAGAEKAGSPDSAAVLRAGRALRRGDAGQPRRLRGGDWSALFLDQGTSLGRACSGR